MNSPSLPKSSRKDSQILNLKDWNKLDDDTSSFQDKPEDRFYTPQSQSHTSKKPARTNIYHQIDCFRAKIQKIISKLGRDLKNSPMRATLRKAPSIGVPIKASNLLALYNRNSKSVSRAPTMTFNKSSSGSDYGQIQNPMERTSLATPAKICNEMLFPNDQQQNSCRKIETPSNVATLPKVSGSFLKSSNPGGWGEKNQETSIHDQIDREPLALLEKFFEKKMLNKYEKKFLMPAVCRMFGDELYKHLGTTDLEIRRRS